MYAKSLGMKVRRIVSISEGGGFQPPRPMMMARAKAYDSAESSPVSPGETTLTANLDVVFELGRCATPPAKSMTVGSTARRAHAPFSSCDPTSVVQGNSVAVRVDPGCRRLIKQQPPTDNA